jgi:hypothetical protein
VTGYGPAPGPKNAGVEESAANEARQARRRLKGFDTHLAPYFMVMAVLVPVNFTLSPGNPCFLLPMVGWGSVLALHAAYAMGLFRRLLGKPQ